MKKILVQRSRSIIFRPITEVQSEANIKYLGNTKFISRQIKKWDRVMNQFDETTLLLNYAKESVLGYS